MSSAFRVSEYLAHILEAIDRLKTGTDGVSKEAFMEDTAPQDIAIRNIGVIGEASHNIIKHHPEFAAAHPELDLKHAYSMRNRLNHGYFAIDLEVVWDTVCTDIPTLQKQVQNIVQAMDDEEGQEQ